jgi:hypothetical protein
MNNLAVYREVIRWKRNLFYRRGCLPISVALTALNIFGAFFLFFDEWSETVTVFAWAWSSE